MAGAKVPKYVYDKAKNLPTWVKCMKNDVRGLLLKVEDQRGSDVSATPRCQREDRLRTVSHPPGNTLVNKPPHPRGGQPPPTGAKVHLCGSLKPVCFEKGWLTICREILGNEGLSLLGEHTIRPVEHRWLIEYRILCGSDILLTCSQFPTVEVSKAVEEVKPS